MPLAKINAISGTQLDQYTAQYAASEADVKSARQALRNAQLNLGYTKIYAQIDGIIESSNGSVGDYVGPGTQIPTLTTIMNIDTVQVPIAIPMTQFLRLDSNRTNIYDNAELLSEIVLYEADGTRYPLFGKYDYTRTAVSSATGTIVLIVRFPNPSYRLKTGQFARVEANIGAKLPRVLVPQQSVVQTLDVSSVWVIRPDSTAEYRKVTPGETFGGMWAIESGLEPGETVAVTGLQKLRQGMRVVPVKNRQVWENFSSRGPFSPLRWRQLSCCWVSFLYSTCRSSSIPTLRLLSSKFRRPIPVPMPKP